MILTKGAMWVKDIHNILLLTAADRKVSENSNGV